MSFNGLIQTKSGRDELAKAEMGGSFNITHIALGDGYFNGSFSSKAALENTVMTLPISKISRENSEVTLQCDFSSKTAPKAFYFREIGIFANGKLCFYDNAGDDAEYIDPDISEIVKQKRLRFVLYISSDTTVNVTIAEGLYALQDDLDKIKQPEFDADTELSEIQSGDEIFTIFGKTAKAIKTLISHLGNKSNPHGVTKSQVGLGNVPNVKTNDQAPTYTAAASLTDLSSGEKVTTAFGKIAKAVHELINHLGNKSNPHNITKSQIGLGNVDNTSDANKPVSTAQYDALIAQYAQLTGYTDQKIADLINGAPSTLNTLKEIADAIASNQAVVEALNNAIGTKANEAELNSHLGNKSNPHVVTKAQVGLGNVPNVATNDQAPTYTAAASLTDLSSGEKVTTAFGKIAKAVSMLISHLGNKSNPHAVTKSQVGLGNVPNVKTNDQAPTFTQASSRTNLVSGEKLTTTLGKIAKWFSDLKTGAFATVANNDTTTAAGYVADARVVKVHGDEIDALNSSLYYAFEGVSNVSVKLQSIKKSVNTVTLMVVFTIEAVVSDNSWQTPLVFPAYIAPKENIDCIAGIGHGVAEGITNVRVDGNIIKVYRSDKYVAGNSVFINMCWTI